MNLPEIVQVPTAKVVLNTGQVEGLPANPRQWTAGDVDRLARSLTETPELFAARPILAVEHGGHYVALGGNLRLTAARKNKDRTVPVIVYPADTPLETLRAIVIKDNGSFGQWDFDALANTWDDLPLADWGVPAWDTGAAAQGAGLHLSTEGREGGEGYDAFVEKFAPKLTTDDCYTPVPVYEALLDWVDRTLGPVDRSKVVRPFYPGGDYRRAEYPEGCIVIDNPPFSIYSEIVRFYLEHGVTFFLFGPHLTLKVKDADVTYVLCGRGVTYENGAVVNTSFVTNMPAVKDYRIIIPVALYRAIGEADEESRGKVSLSRYRHPLELWTLPVLSKIAKGEVDYYVPKNQVEEIQNLDCLKAQDKSLFGGGFLFCSAAAREAAAREAAALELSEREKAIVAILDARNI